MDDIYYLVHTTSKNPAQFKTLRTTPSCKDAQGGQFPGVFMTLVTRHNIEKELFYSGRYVAIFSKELLKQKNYHINVMDCNGMVTENVTYYPWNLTEAVNWIKTKKYGGMNEVVFHDDIDIKKYLCDVKIRPSFLKDDKKVVEKYFMDGGISSLLPHKVMKTAAEPDMTKLPFYCYNMEDMWGGIPAIPKSSLQWFKLLVQVANIEKVPNSIQGCIDVLREKSVYLCKHREEQNIQLLKDYTGSKSGRRTRKRATKL